MRKLKETAEMLRKSMMTSSTSRIYDVIDWLQSKKRWRRNWREKSANVEQRWKRKKILWNLSTSLKINSKLKRARVKISNNVSMTSSINQMNYVSRLVLKPPPTLTPISLSFVGVVCVVMTSSKPFYVINACAWFVVNFSTFQPSANQLKGLESKRYHGDGDDVMVRIFASSATYNLWRHNDVTCSFVCLLHVVFFEWRHPLTRMRVTSLVS